MKWIASEGGPLIVIDADHVLAWEGTDIPSEGRKDEAEFRWQGPDSPATDYDRACDVTGYIGIVPVGNGQALILGDEPMQTTLWSDEQQSYPLLVRWMYADSEEEVVAALHTLPEDIWAAEPFTFIVSSSPLFIFDSALSGHLISTKPADTYLYFALPAGPYRITTADYRPDSRIRLVLHRFQAIVS